MNPKPVEGALYTLDIGANDIMNALEDKIPPSELKTVMMQAEVNTIDSVKALVGLERNRSCSTKFRIRGYPALQRAQRYRKTASDLVHTNTAVLNGLAGFKSDGLKVFTLDTYGLLGEIKADPSHFGFTNVSDPCWTGNFTDPTSGMVCRRNRPPERVSFGMRFTRPRRPFLDRGIRRRRADRSP